PCDVRCSATHRSADAGCFAGKFAPSPGLSLARRSPHSHTFSRANGIARRPEHFSLARATEAHLRGVFSVPAQPGPGPPGHAQGKRHRLSPERRPHPRSFETHSPVPTYIGAKTYPS